MLQASYILSTDQGCKMIWEIGSQVACSTGLLHRVTDHPTTMHDPADMVVTKHHKGSLPIINGHDVLLKVVSIIMQNNVFIMSS